MDTKQIIYICDKCGYWRETPNRHKMKPTKMSAVDVNVSCGEPCDNWFGEMSDYNKGINMDKFIIVSGNQPIGLFDKMTGKQINARKDGDTWYFLHHLDIERFERNSVSGEKMINGLGLVEMNV